MSGDSVEPQISLVQEKASQRQQIEAILLVAREKKEPLRVRIPVSLYDYTSPSRNYTFLRDAVWNLTLPADLTTPEAVERFIYTLGCCISAVAEQGSEAVLRKLQAPAEPAA